MGLIPDTKVGKIEFCEAHVSPFTTNAVAIGTTSSAVTAWSAQVTAARAAYNAQVAAQEAAKNATINLNIALRAMMASTSSIINQVRAKAALTGDGVYALASLPVPATPTPKPAPGKPYELAVTLSEIGALTLKWKCNTAGASGTIYQVWRQVGTAGAGGAGGAGGALEYLGGTGTKEFVDATVPAGAASIVYQIQAVRSTAVGEWATFNVKFGTGSAGGAGGAGGALATIASVEETAGPVKRAA